MTTPQAAHPQEVLIVDDDEGLRYTLREILEDADFTVAEAADAKAALQLCDERPFGLVITDLRMPGMDGMQLLQQLRERNPAARVVLVTAHGSERQAVEAMKAGAWDYFRKPFDNDELLNVVRRALETTALVHENERLHGTLALSGVFVFVSAEMQRLASLIVRLAPRDVTVLITGESGTGKERVADALWRSGKRADKPFVRFNCAALGGELADAELFGHTKGAFTGAVKARKGLFVEAHGGTLLLDEIAELAPDVQAKLLRVLQEGEVRAVGDDRVQKVDVRVIAATHRDLRERVSAGSFREDLFYRLNVATLRVPPLRERADDIAVLARHFLERFADRFGVQRPTLTPELHARLMAYAWPGNVRELEHAIESTVALSPDGALDLTLLPAAAVMAALHPTLSLKQRVDAYERGLVVEALRTTRGNRSQAARDLGLSRVTLHDKLKKYGISNDEELP